MNKEENLFIDKSLLRLENENEEQYIWRVGELKTSGRLDADWDTIADAINKQFRCGEEEYRVESAYRKIYQAAKKFYDAGVFKDLTTEKYISLLRIEQQELRKERQKLSDERVDFQRTVREEARKESFIDLIERTLSRNVEPLEYKQSPVIDSDEDMIVCLSDLHAGIEVENHWNTYNTGILKKRLNKYIDEIKEIQSTHKVHRCELVLGGDAISGFIHPNLRLENNENVIEQIKIAITYIGEFISALQDDFSEIRVHSVAGNHSRLSPNKENHLRGEELEALIPYCLKIKFENNPQVIIYEDGQIDNTINTFITRGGKLFYLVHGDKDTPSNVVKNLTLMIGSKPDAVLLAHRHHNAFDTQFGVKVIQMGAIVGTDDHCVDIRISGEPEQCVVITSREKTIKCLYDICLK